MDAFYASVEELKNPSLKQKALVVAHDPRKNNGHGVVTTSNYNARRYGVFFQQCLLLKQLKKNTSK